jgi:hypothetical protein
MEGALAVAIMMESLVCDKCCSKSIHLLTNLILSTSVYWGWKMWSTTRLKNLSKMTLLVSGSTGISVHTGWLQVLDFTIHYLSSRTEKKVAVFTISQAVVMLHARGVRLDYFLSALCITLHALHSSFEVIWNINPPKNVIFRIFLFSFFFWWQMK